MVNCDAPVMVQGGLVDSDVNSFFHPPLKVTQFCVPYISTFQADGVAWAVHVKVPKHRRGGDSRSTVLHDMCTQRYFSLPNLLPITSFTLDVIHHATCILASLVFGPDENLPYGVVSFWNMFLL